ncbi:MAG: hypothetical protein ABW185_29025 [Sedimenticola sp.]
MVTNKDVFQPALMIGVDQSEKNFTLIMVEATSVKKEFGAQSGLGATKVTPTVLRPLKSAPFRSPHSATRPHPL